MDESLLRFFCHFFCDIEDFVVSVQPFRPKSRFVEGFTICESIFLGESFTGHPSQLVGPMGARQCPLPRCDLMDEDVQVGPISLETRRVGLLMAEIWWFPKLTTVWMVLKAYK